MLSFIELCIQEAFLQCPLQVGESRGKLGGLPNRDEVDAGHDCNANLKKIEHLSLNKEKTRRPRRLEYMNGYCVACQFLEISCLRIEINIYIIIYLYLLTLNVGAASEQLD